MTAIDVVDGARFDRHFAGLCGAEDTMEAIAVIGIDLASKRDRPSAAGDPRCRAAGGKRAGRHRARPSRLQDRPGSLGVAGARSRQHSSGGKERLGGITKAGDTCLRKMLFVGAMAVIRHAERYGTHRPWLTKLLSRRSPRVAAIALANKIGRTAWALMTSGERYREPVVA